MNHELSGPIITVIGAGTVGSCVLEQLARQENTDKGVLIVVDPDQVEAHNLPKSALFCRADIGRRKVEVVAQRLGEIIPDVHVLPIHQPVEALGAGLFRTSDMVLVCVDNRLAKFYCNRSSRAAGTPHLLVAELEGGASLTGRLRAYSPGSDPEESACMECSYSDEDYAQLNQLRQPCSQVFQPDPAVQARPGRLSPAWRLASETVEEVERCLAGHPGLAPGQELRLLPEQRQYLLLRTARKPDCLCPHSPPELGLEFKGNVEELTIGDFANRVTHVVGTGWAWLLPANALIHHPRASALALEEGVLKAADLALLANQRMVSLWPAGDILRLSSRIGEIVWAALPVRGLVPWLYRMEGEQA